MDGLFDALFEPLRFGFMARALAVAVLIGLLCPVIGAYVVTRGLAFMGDALAHAVLPGLVAAYLIGISPFAGAVVAGLTVALLIGYLSRRAGISEDTAIGILFAGLFALGLTMLSLSKGVSVDLEGLLLGQVLGVSVVDVYVTLGLAGLVLVVLFGFHKELVFSSFDPVGAAVAGLPTTALGYLLLLLLALVIIVSLQAVGIVLVMAMLVTPAATAYLLVKSFLGMMVVGAALGVFSAVTGLYLSFYLNIPSGPAMTLVAVGLFATTSALRRRVV